MSIHEKLFNLQSQIGAIAKDSKNPFFKSKYFDVNSLIDTLKPYLQEEELLLIQPIQDGKVVSQIIDIGTGDTVASEMKLPDISDPQKMGSAITYYRRYTLQSLLALQAEDDDGNTASKETKKPQKQTLTPDMPRWEKVVHAIASGKSTINEVQKVLNLSEEHKAKLVAEALEFKNEQ